jgi:DNA-binding MarR family transcriptional regulator
MSATWLDETEQRAWRNFITTLPDLNAAFEADLGAHDLTMGDYEVLVVLSEADEQRMRMCDLADALRLSPSGLTRRLDGMVTAGWVHRAACSSDRRVMYANLTPAGRSKMEMAAPAHVQSVRRHFLEPLGNDGVQQLSALFGLIRDQLSAAEPA